MYLAQNVTRAAEIGLHGVCAHETINYAIRQKGGCGWLVASMAMRGQKERRKSAEKAQKAIRAETMQNNPERHKKRAPSGYARRFASCRQ